MEKTKKKLKLVRGILLIFILAVCSGIFMFSNQQGEKSNSTSDVFTVKIVDILSKDKELSKKEYNELFREVRFWVRKAAHFSIYTILGMFIMTIIGTFTISNIKRSIISILIGFIYATTDELHQYFVPERSAEFRDVCIDTSGIILGIFIVLIIETIVIKISKIIKRKKMVKN